MRTLLIGLLGLGMVAGAAHGAAIIMETNHANYTDTGWAASSGNTQLTLAGTR